MEFTQLGSTPLQRTFPKRGWGVSCVSGEVQLSKTRLNGSDRNNRVDHRRLRERCEGVSLGSYHATARRGNHQQCMVASGTVGQTLPRRHGTRGSSEPKTLIGAANHISTSLKPLP